MDLSGNTVLVTGGGSGIGLAIARRFLDAGSRVVVCGRGADRLAAAREANPGLETRVADVGDASGREELISWMISEYLDFDVLVNNAGIQRQGRFVSDTADWPTRQREIAINLEAPLHLVTLVLDQFRARPRAAVINVSSGFAFVPAPIAPVYGATKAALHSFTMTLRAELEGTPIEVAEIVPPVVDTPLGGPGLHTYGVSSDEFAESVIDRIAAGELEVGYDFSEGLRHATRGELDERFDRMVEATR